MVHWLQRVVLPAVLCLLGVGAVVYGALRHSAVVIDQEETKITLTVDATGKVVPPGMEHLVGAGPASISGGDLPAAGTDGAAAPAGLDPSGLPIPPDGMGTMPGQGPGPGFPPGLAEMFMPPFSKKTLAGEPVDVEKIELETNLVREVTVGGVVLSDGVLRRTYIGTPPSLCPT
jgi:hypothetical protein